MNNILLFSEIFHVISHVFVLCFGSKIIRRDQIATKRMYFVWDVCSVTFTMLSVKMPIIPLIYCVFQNIQHWAYIFYWDKSKRTSDVITWSSIEWKKKKFILDFHHFIFVWGGTLYDIIAHMICIYYITKSEHLNSES